METAGDSAQREGEKREMGDVANEEAMKRGEGLRRKEAGMEKQIGMSMIVLYVYPPCACTNSR